MIQEELNAKALATNEKEIREATGHGRQNLDTTAQVKGELKWENAAAYPHFVYCSCYKESTYMNRITTPMEKERW